MRARRWALMAIIRFVENVFGISGGRVQFLVRASLLAIVPSLLLFGAFVALRIDTLRAPPNAFEPAFVVYSLLVAPALETAVMLALAAVLTRAAPRHTALQIVLTACIAALAHGMGGEWRRVGDTAWPILVYSASLVLWLRRSAIDAYILTTILHALYNAAFFVVGILGPLAMMGQR
jgi:hypothetical protein